MKYYSRLFALAGLGVFLTALYGCGGQQESKTIQQGDTPPAMGKTAPAAGGAGTTGGKPKLLSVPPP